MPIASTAVISRRRSARPAGPGRGRRPGRGHGPSDEVRPEAGGGPEERVAFGHSGRRSRGGTKRRGRDSRPRSRPRAGAVAHGDAADVVAVDLADDELADAPVGDERAQGPERGDRHGRVVGGGERLERRPAALEVEGGDAVDQDDVGAGRPLERPPVGLAAARPGERRAVRVGRVGGGEEVDRAGGRRIGRLARPRAAGRARRPGRTGRPRARRRSSRAGSGRRPPSPGGPGRPPRSRRRRPRPRRPRGSGRRAARAAPGSGRGAVPWRSPAPASGATSDQRPAASGGPSAVSRPGRPTVRRPPLPVRFQRSARSGANVSLVTSPAQTRSHSASRTSRSEVPRAAANSSR